MDPGDFAFLSTGGGGSQLVFPPEATLIQSNRPKKATGYNDHLEARRGCRRIHTSLIGLREIVRKHSDFIPFPIYIGEDTDSANQRTAIWRQSPREVEKETYDPFTNNLLSTRKRPCSIHTWRWMRRCSCTPFYSSRSSAERGLFILRREPGLKLYARNVLIQGVQ